jgi:hypothetical protein
MRLLIGAGTTREAAARALAYLLLVYVEQTAVIILFAASPDGVCHPRHGRYRRPRLTKAGLRQRAAKARCYKHQQSPMRGSNNCEVDTRTIRDESGRKKLGRETTAADLTIARIPKVGLLQPRWRLLRYFLSQPCRSFLFPRSPRLKTIANNLDQRNRKVVS